MMATADEPPPRAVVTSRAFERDLKRLRKRGLDPARLFVVIEAIRTRQTLETRHRDHALMGAWRGFRECHVAPDWLLVYQLDDEAVYLTRSGSHADLFE